MTELPVPRMETTGYALCILIEKVLMLTDELLQNPKHSWRVEAVRSELSLLQRLYPAKRVEVEEIKEWEDAIRNIPRVP